MVSLWYRMLYGIGFKPWDRDDPVPELVQAVDGRAPGRALDLGCGTGAQSVYLAQQGWDVTAVDVVPRALKAARRRGQAAGIDSIDFRAADVGQLGLLGLNDVALAFDRGCFHGLPEEARDGYARGLTTLARPGALLLLMAFGPPTPPGMPSGATREELEARLGSAWRMVAADKATDMRSARIERAGPVWYRFVRT
jgi:SAM-dependent methyltransferase